MMAPCLDLIDNCGLRFCNLLVPCFLGRRSQVLPPGALLLLSWDHVFCLFHNPCPSRAMWNPRASPELVNSSWKFPHQLFAPPPTWDRAPEYNQPKDTEPGSGSGSRSIYDTLSQSWPVLGSELRKPLALVSGATGICIWEKGDRGPGSPPVPTMAAHLSHSHPIFVHSFWFGV